MVRKVLRRAVVWIVAVAAAATAILVAVALWTPLVGDVAWPRVVSLVEEQFGIRVEAGRFDLDLAQLRVEITDLRLTGVTPGAPPFLAVDDVTVDIPWSVVWGELAVDEVTLVNPAVSVIQTADGVSNLPAFGGDDPAPAETAPVRVRLGEVDVRGLTVEWRDEAGPLALRLAPTSLRLTGDDGRVRGPLRSEGATTVSWGERTTEISRLEGDVGFDGANIDIERLDISASEGDLELSGRVEEVTGRPRLALQYETQLDLAEVGAWADLATAAGDLRAAGSVAGPVDETEVDATLTADSVAWEAFRVDRLAATVQVTPTAFRLPRIQIGLAGGEVSGDGVIERGDETPGQVRVTWAGLDLDRLLAAAGVEQVALGTALTGELEARWSALEPDNLVLTVRSGSRRGTLTGTTVVQAGGGDWRVTVDEPVGPAARVTGEIRTRMSGDWSAAPLSGTVSIACDRVASCIETVNAGFDRESLPPVDGRVTADLDLAGTLGSPGAAGRVEAPNLVVGAVPPASVAVRFQVDTSRVDIAELRVAAGPNELSGGGRWSLDTSEVEATLAGRLGDLSALAPLLPAGMAPSGAGRVDLTAEGPVDRLRAEVTLAFEAVTLAGQPFDAVTGRVSLDGPSVEVDRLAVRRDGTSLELAGRYDLEADTMTLAVTSDRFPVTPLFPESPGEIPLSARVTLDAEVTGSGAAPRVDGRVQLADLAWGDYAIGRIEARATSDGERVRFEADGAALGARVDGSLELGADQRFEVRARFTDTDLARLAGGAAPVRGALTAAAEASGTVADPAAAAVTFQVERVSGAVGDVPFGAAGPFRADYGGGELRVADADLTVGDVRVRVSGGLGRAGDAPLRAEVAGDVADFTRLAEAWSGTPPPVVASGGVTMTVTASGPFDAPDVSGDLTVDDGTVAVGDLAPVADLNVRASLRNGVITVDAVSATWAEARLDATAEVPLALGGIGASGPAGAPADLGRPARVRATISSLTPAVLGGAAPGDAVQGRISAELDLEATAASLEAVRARLTLPEASLQLAGVPFAQRRPTALTVDGGRVTIEAFDWGNSRDYLTLGGGLTLDGVPAADVSLTGAFDLRTAAAFTPGVATAGAVRLIADLTGPLDAPVLRGTVEVDDGELRMADPRLVVSDLNGALFLTGDAIRIHELRGQANGGPVELGGGWSLGDGDRRITLTGENIALEIPEGFRSEARLAVDVVSTDDGVVLSGMTTISRGAYREPITLAGGLLAALQQPPAVATAGADAAGASDAIRIDLQVATDDDIIVNNNYLDVEVGANLRVQGTLAQPAVTGRAAVREGGRVRFGNRVYEVETGAVDLIDPGGIEPVVNMTARTRVRGQDITLSVNGGRETLTTDLRSETDPAMSESDIISLLLTGRSLDEATTAPGAIARDQALGLASTELLGQAGQSVGLDLQVGTTPDLGQEIFDSSLIATELNPGARLTVGRDLSDRVRLIFSQGLRDGDLAWIVDYLPLTNAEIRAFFNDDNERAYEFRHALSMGAPPRTVTAASARPPRPTLRVSEVDLRGDLGTDETTLRETLRTRPGDQFEFYRWQADVDRLEAWFDDAGFLEARVRARRAVDRAAGTVALDYEIIRGPRTRLVVQGYELSDDLRQRLDDQWTVAVFDAFLLEEMTTLVTAALAEDGFVRATVEATVDEAAGGADGATPEKTITLDVEPGPRSTDRRLIVEGAAPGDEAALRELLAALDPDTSAWADPEPVVEAVDAWYRGRGHLHASVRIGDPRFDGASAMLPVHVDPGPRFRVGEVTFVGVESRPETELASMLALRRGDVYAERRLQDGRSRVEASYRRAGYTTVRVAARTSLVPEQETVEVEIEVREGPRQIIEEVVVEGASRTHPSLVANALRLRPGEPVDLASWNQARKRLYDTGVFRSVDIEARPRAGQDTESTVPVEAHVLLEEWPQYRLRYGLRVTDELAPLDEAGRTLRVGAAADLSRRNLFGRGLTAGVSSRVDFDRQAVRGFLTVPTLFGRRIESNFFVSERRERILTDIVELVTTVTAEQRLRPGRGVTMAYGASLDRIRSIDESSGLTDLDALTIKIARFDGSAILERRDNLFDATSGTFHSANFEYGVVLGGTLTFAKYWGQHFFYRPVGPVVLASAARLGLASGLGGSLLIPSERFFAGGGNTVRGFAQDSLGPIDPIFGEPSGGNALLVLNQEVRFPIVSIVRGVGFFDAGNVFPAIRDISLPGLETSVGVGLRIASPIGLIRVDYGVALDPPAGDPRGRFFFSLGQAF